MPEAPTYRNALPLNTMLLEYRLESVLGAGGFGITYLGWDTNLEKHVAIKEYLPGELAIRALDGSVLPVNTENEYNYKWGLDRFIQEARTLAKFSHPNIVRVNRFFEANGTSYMVMDYEAGESLHQYLRRTPMPDEAALKNILMPILDGLQAVHKVGFLHRDIKPSNVFIRENGIPVLLDFGSARMAAGSISKSMTAIVSPGYAPLEQYSNDGNQGPWSDIYALSAVICRAVTSENPPDAVKRMKLDSVPHALTAARTRYSERFLKAIEWGMTLDERMRPQSIAEWRDLFLGRAPMTAFSRGAAISPPRPAAAAPTVVAATVRVADNPLRTAKTVPQRRDTNVESTRGRKAKWPIAIGLALIGLAFAAIMSQHPRTPETAGLQPATGAPGAPRNEPQAPSRNEPRSSDPAPPLAAQPAPATPQDETVTASVPQPPAPATKAQTVTDALPELTLAQRRGLAEAFRGADRDGNGFLTADEVRGKFPFIEQNFSQVDTDRDGRISAGELLQLRKKQQRMKSPR